MFGLLPAWSADRVQITDSTVEAKKLCTAIIVGLWTAMGETEGSILAGVTEKVQ